MIKEYVGNITIWFLMFTVIILNGCNTNDYKHPRKPIEAPNCSVKIERFEKELFSLDSNNLKNGLATLYNKYGVFYTSYANDIMRMPFEGDSLFETSMRMLIGIDRLRELQQIVDSNFNDVSDLEKDLSKAMGIYKQEFPDATIPRFVSFISEFGHGNVIYDSMICIGLDLFMNKRFEDFYRALSIPEFRIVKMQRNYIVPNTIRALAFGQFDHQTSIDKRFLAQMIIEGKKNYFVTALLPNVVDTVVMGYTKSQMKWCQDNEVEIWTHFIEKNMLYDANPGKYMRYLNDGPFTVAEDVPKESSPAIGTWVGWQIINHYMKNNPEVTLKEMMEETDFEKILRLSKYRPK
jgi:hypothetical protein